MKCKMKLPPSKSWFQSRGGERCEKPKKETDMPKKKSKLVIRKPSKATVAAVAGARKEIFAGSVMLPKSEGDRVWNQCIERAVDILKRYEIGHGLFQMVP